MLGTFISPIHKMGERGDPMLPNPAANHFYYDRLVVANGGVQDFHTYYGISLNAFKTAINNVFTSLEDENLSTKIKRWTPRLGSIAATQSLNAISPTSVYDGSFSGGVSFSTAGVIFDGINGYEDTNFLQTEFGADTTNVGLSFKLVSNNFSGSMTVLGVNVGGTFTEVRFSAGNLFNYVGLPDFMDTIAVSNDFFTYNRINTTNTTYRGGALVNNNGGFGTNTMGAFDMVIGAMSTDGVISRYADCTLRNEVFHDGLNSQEASDLYTILTAFDTALGR